MPEITDPSLLAELNGASGGARPTAPSPIPITPSPGGEITPIFTAPQSPQQQSQLRRDNVAITRDQATLPSDIAKSKSDAANAARQGPNSDRDDRRKLYDDFHADPAVKNYEQALPVYIAGLQSAPNSQGDLNLIYAYAKVMDPNSVVREGEAASVANSQTWMENVKAQLQKQLTGEGGTFSTRTRQRLREEMLGRVTELDNIYNTKRRDFRATAQSYGYNPHEIIGTHPGDAYRKTELDFMRGNREQPVAPLATPTLKADSPDEVRVPLLDGGDGKTEAQRQQDQLASEIRALLEQGATRDQLDEYVTRMNRERGTRFNVPSQWQGFEDVMKARDAGGKYDVASPPLIYQRSDPRGDDKREGPSLLGAVGNAAINAINPVGAIPQIAEAGGNLAEGLGLTGAQDKGDAFARGFRDVQRLGLNDEISAAQDAALEGGVTDFSRRFDQKIGEQHATDQYDQANSPGFRIAGQLAGGLAMPTKVPVVGRQAFNAAAREAFITARMSGLTFQEARAAAASAARNAAINAGARQTAIEGGIVGGAYGTGSADGGVGDRVIGGVTGGALGATAGYALGQALPRAGGALADYAASRGTANALGDVARAANQEGIDVGRPVVDPSTRNRMAYLEASVGGSNRVRDSIARTKEQIADRAGRLAGDGAVQEPGMMGETIQAAGRRFLDTSGTAARRLYDRAAAEAGDAPVHGQEAVAALTARITELQQNPQTNRALIRYLEDVRSDFLNPDGTIRPKTVAAVRDIRTNLRGEIDRRNLGMSRAETYVGEALDAARADITRDLGQAAPNAIRLFERADQAWARRQAESRQVIKLIVGDADNPLSGQKVMDRLAAMSKADTGRFRRVIDKLTPEERRDYVATVVDRLGRDTPDGEFNMGMFVRRTRQIDPAAQRVLFSPEGVQSIANLQRVIKAVQDTKGRLNNSRSGQVIQWGNFLKSLLAPALPAAAGGALGGGSGAVAGAVAGSAVAAAGAGYRNLSARSLMNPAFARWLAQAPEQRTPGAIAQHANRLSIIASRNPAISQELLGLQKLITNFANDNTIGISARSAAEGENQQEGAQ